MGDRQSRVRTFPYGEGSTGWFWYLEAVLSLAQGAVPQRGSAEMADGDELPGEGDIAAPALSQQLLALHLLLHLRRNPELMLGGRPGHRQRDEL